MQDEEICCAVLMSQHSERVQQLGQNSQTLISLKHIYICENVAYRLSFAGLQAMRCVLACKLCSAEKLLVNFKGSMALMSHDFMPVVAVGCQG